jgi:hypothetical protein
VNKWFILGYIYVIASWTINFKCVKITFRHKTNSNWGQQNISKSVYTYTYANFIFLGNLWSCMLDWYLPLHFLFVWLCTFMYNVFAGQHENMILLNREQNAYNTSLFCGKNSTTSPPQEMCEWIGSLFLFCMDLEG